MFVKRSASQWIPILLLCAALPYILFRWARTTEHAVQMPPYGTPAGGLFLVAGGLSLMFLGFSALRRATGQLVTTGVYKWLPHPIYLGVGLLAWGAAMILRSPSGLWLVAPTVMLACAVLVLGHERPELERRFGQPAREYLWLPADTEASPAGMARIRCYLFLLIPWVLIYEIIVWSGTPKDAFSIALPFERSWPVIPWAEPLYMSTYYVVGLTPLLATTSRSLRQFMLRAWLAMAIAFSLYLALPVVAPHKPLLADGFWARLLAFERSADPPLNAFPSFHTIWAILAAELLAVRNRRTGWLWRLWAIGVAASCVATGMHWIADVVAGILLSLALIHIRTVWASLLAWAGGVANSWREWQIGPFAILPHGLYAGAAVATAVLLAGVLIGPGHELTLALATTAGLAAAALWSWSVRDASVWRRDSYYAGLIGVAIGALLIGDRPTLIAAAFCVATPWMLAIARLRCLAYGCCHGRLAPDDAGIRFCHPSSEAGRDPRFRNQPLHPTQLYSMLWSMFCGIVLARMWWAGCELHMIAGLFAMLSGMGRFVEEAYRAEFYTHSDGRWRPYQWMAAAAVIGGGILTALPVTAEAPPPSLNLESLTLAVAFGMIAAIAAGVELRTTNSREPSELATREGR